MVRDEHLNYDPIFVERSFTKVEIEPWVGMMIKGLDNGEVVEKFEDWQNKPQQVLSKGRHLVTQDLIGNAKVAFKFFGRQPILKDRFDAWKGTKAARSFKAAVHLAEAGVHTPAPIGYFEDWRGNRLHRSTYISKYVTGLASMKEHLVRLYRSRADIHDIVALLSHVALAIRQLHDSGFHHRDLGNQNMEFALKDDQYTPVHFLDLNRGQIKDALTDKERAGDLSRLTLPGALVPIFSELYWGGPVPPAFAQKLESGRKRFALWQSSRKLRHPFAPRRKPNARSYPNDGDLWIWDHKTAQAAVLHGRKVRRQLRTTGDSLKTIGNNLKALPEVFKNYRNLKSRAFKDPVAMDTRIGISLEAVELPLEPQLEFLAELPVRLPVLIRYAHHQNEEGWTKSDLAIRALLQRGHEVMIAILQDREAVRNLQAWRAFLERVFKENHDRVTCIEVTHAVNRSKWGIYSLAEFRDLIEPLVEIRSKYPKARITGPACIDFEYHRVVNLLEALPTGFQFDDLSHHLYVDRRGAPESFQGNFSLLEKAALLKAIAQHGRISSGQVIVSEVNWPIRDSHDWSPVDATHLAAHAEQSPLNVSEEIYADYMERYFLISLCSGLVERVYWWRLVAHGFGLIDERGNAGYRQRPAFARLKKMLVSLEGATFTGRIQGDDPNVYCLLFQFPDERQLLVAWTSAEASELNLPAMGVKILITGSPAYHSFTPPSTP